MIHTAVDGCRTDASSSQILDLVFHQGYQGGDDNADTFHRQSRHLEGDRFSTTRWHQSQSVMPRTDRLDDLTLYTAEIIVAPVLLKK